MKNKKQSAVYDNALPKMMKVAEVSAYIGVPQKYLREQIKAGILPVFRVNSRNYYIYTEPMLRLFHLNENAELLKEA